MAGNNFYPVSTPGAPRKCWKSCSALFCAIALAAVLSFGVSGCSLGAGRTGVTPVVGTVTPNQGTVASAVKITGSNFGATQAAGDTVTFNGKPATIISWSDTAIVTDVPADATTGNVVVGANGVTGAGINFTVLTGATAGCGTGSESVLSGTYAYEMSGFMGAGLGTSFARAGSFKANGSGVISGGDEDLNVGTLGDTHHTIVEGSYSIGADNRGCVTLNYGASSTTFRFSLGTLTNNVAARGHIIEFDDSSNNGSGSRASGIILQQTVGSNTGASLLANYAFGMQGADPTGGHVALGGTFTLAPALATNNITNGYLDYNDAATLRFAGTTNAAFGNMLTTGANISSTTGRTTATFSAQTACASTTCTYHWAVYVVNPNQMFLISTDTLSANTPLVSGRAISTLSPTSFTTASLSNANGYILEAAGSIAGIADAQLQQIKFNSIGNLFASAGWTYSVDVGHIVNTPINSPAILTGGYLVSTAGRVTFSTSNNLVVYLTDPTAASGIAGFVVGVDPSKPTAYSGLLITQQATKLSSGTYFMGTSDVLDNTVPSFVGAAGVQTTSQAPITNTVGGAVDVSQVGGLSSTTFSNTTFNFTMFATPSLGTFTDAAGNTLVGIADGTALFYMEETTSGTPTDPAAIVVIDQ